MTGHICEWKVEGLSVPDLDVSPPYLAQCWSSLVTLLRRNSSQTDRVTPSLPMSKVLSATLDLPRVYVVGSGDCVETPGTHFPLPSYEVKGSTPPFLQGRSFFLIRSSRPRGIFVSPCPCVNKDNHIKYLLSVPFPLRGRVLRPQTRLVRDPPSSVCVRACPPVYICK